ncbi:calcium-binding protein [Achromobacter xylosoxidans]
MRIKDYFFGTNGRYVVDRLEFSDGSVLTYDDIVAGILGATSGDDIIYGTNAGETIRGQEGNDTLYGEGGDDILDGGAGDDTLYGGEGSDTYLFYDIRATTPSGKPACMAMLVTGCCSMRTSCRRTSPSPAQARRTICSSPSRVRAIPCSFTTTSSGRCNATASICSNSPTAPC